MISTLVGPALQVTPMPFFARLYNKHRHRQEWTVDWPEIVVNLLIMIVARMLRKRDNCFPVYVYIELNTCIDVKSYTASTKHLYNIDPTLYVIEMWVY